MTDPYKRFAEHLSASGIPQQDIKRFLDQERIARAMYKMPKGHPELLTVDTRPGVAVVLAQMENEFK